MTEQRAKVASVGRIRDPAVAAAVGKCWLWRWSRRVPAYSRMVLTDKIERLHDDEPCGFCEYPADGLIRALEEFVEWSGLSTEAVDSGRPFRPEVEAFIRLPNEEQHRLVRDAQYGDA